MKYMIIKDSKSGKRYCRIEIEVTEELQRVLKEAGDRIGRDDIKGIRIDSEFLRQYIQKLKLA